ncbi:MAG: transposase [Deltaproteobacteria bacterium]|nr:transposase [Deltaproteobacteria bacterium]
MKYNPDIHHRGSIRLKGYDYSQAGLYFITICTQNRKCIFGKIIDNGKGTMICFLNEYGRIAEREWIKTSEMRHSVHLDVFVIMPNHIHGIIQINKIDDCRGTMRRARMPMMRCTRMPMHPTIRKGTIHRAPTAEQFGKPTSNTIPTIIRGYKSSVTKQINILRNKPGVPVWQRNYYEHIIRDEKSYYKISEYIKTNPLKWPDDKYYA